MLALREHSRAELQRKLLSWTRRQTLKQAAQAADTSPDAVDDDDTVTVAAQSDIAKLLDELEQRGFLSDQRAADALLHAKAPRYGQRRLKQLLQARSLDADLVSASLAKARGSEFDRALDIWRRRFGTAPGNMQERAKQQRFLAGRGFEGAVIDKVLRQAGRDGPDGAADDTD